MDPPFGNSTRKEHALTTHSKTPDESAGLQKSLFQKFAFLLIKFVIGENALVSQFSELL
jgi:hypothetical protein